MKVGVIIPLGSPLDGGVPRYAETREFAAAADESALDSVWVFDHLIYELPDFPVCGAQEAWTVLTAVGEVTKRVELGSLVLCSPFRNPALLAKMAVTLDEISGGRLILGLGAGWHKPEFDAFGYPFDNLVDRFEEALKIIVPLVKEGKVDFTGSYYAAPDCSLLPPPRDGGIPILIASFKPRMLALTARYADLWNTAWLGDTSLLAERRATIEQACVEAERDPKTLGVTVGVSVGFPELGGLDDEIDPAKMLAGSVEQVAAGLRDYADAGVEHVICALAKKTPEAVALLSAAWVLAKRDVEP